MQNPYRVTLMCHDAWHRKRAFTWPLNTWSWARSAAEASRLARQHVHQTLGWRVIVARTRNGHWELKHRWEVATFCCVEAKRLARERVPL